MRNFWTMVLLIAALVGVHFVIASVPGATKSVAQAAVFAVPGLTIFAGIGLLGTLLISFTRLPGHWDPDIPLSRKLVWPLLVGLLLGASQAATDHATGWGAAMAHQMKMATIHIAWPLSAVIYPGGAILVSIAYFLSLVPLVVVLVQIVQFFWRWRFETLTLAISRWWLRGRALDLVYWAIAIPSALIEPITQGDFKGIGSGNPGQMLFAAEDVAMNLAQVWFLRRAGFVACVLVRIGFYAVWHVLWPLIGG